MLGGGGRTAINKLDGVGVWPPPPPECGDMGDGCLNWCSLTLRRSGLARLTELGGEINFVSQ